MAPSWGCPLLNSYWVVVLYACAAVLMVENFASLNSDDCNLQDFGTTSSSMLALCSWNGSGLSHIPHISLVPGACIVFLLSTHYVSCCFFKAVTYYPSFRFSYTNVYLLMLWELSGIWFFFWVIMWIWLRFNGDVQLLERFAFSFVPEPWWCSAILEEFASRSWRR